MFDYRVVDVFAEAKFGGNPLAVVLGAETLDPASMQAIAREFNLSETTFVGAAEADGGWEVRIFTPAAELPFAGHPTLGTAWVLRAEHALGDQVVLQLGVGPVRVEFSGEEDEELAWLHAPTPTLGRAHARADAAALLGLDPTDLDPTLPVQEASAGISFLMIPLAGLAALRRARLDPARRDRFRDAGLTGGVYLFCRESHEPGRELASRMLFEAGGVREDPATGSASVCLGGYLLHHRVFGAGTLDVRVEQGYEIQRPSLIRVRGRMEQDVPHVAVGGRVIPVARGLLG